jgi:hypothetical protein
MLRELAVFVAVVGGLVVGSPAQAVTGSTPTIVDVKPPSSTVRTGSSLTFQVIAENGKGSSTASYRLNFLLSANGISGARKIGDGTIPAIPAKTRKTFSFTAAIPSNAKAGDFRLLLCHPRAGRSAYCHDDKAKVKVTLAPAKLTITPSGFGFGSVAVGTDSAAKRFTVRNVGRKASGSVSTGLSGTQKTSFKITSKTCGASLAPNATCRIDVMFKPSAIGVRKAALKATPSATYSKGATVTVSGDGVSPAALQVTPDTVAFGSVFAGEPGSRTLTVTNTGQATSGVPDFSAIFAPFSVTPGTCTAPLAQNATCTATLTYAPGPGTSIDTQLPISASPGQNDTVHVTGTGASSKAKLELGVAGDFSQPVVFTFPGDIILTHTSIAVFQLKNTGGADAQLSSPRTSYVNQGTFVLAGTHIGLTTCPSSGGVIVANQTCDFAVAINPGTTGNLNVKLTVNGWPGGNPTAEIHGTIVP